MKLSGFFDGRIMVAAYKCRPTVSSEKPRLVEALNAW